MRWQMGRRSENIEDQRGMSRAGLGRGVQVGGIGGLGVLAIALVAMFFGVDPSVILNNLPMDDGSSQTGVGAAQRSPARRQPGGVRLGRAGTDRGHLDRHLQAGRPDLSGAASWCCSAARSSRPAAWPARRPGRSTAPATARSTSTLASSSELQQRFGASGDFADAYVIAHEVGHHVQTLLGIPARSAGRAAR